MFLYVHITWTTLILQFRLHLREVGSKSGALNHILNMKTYRGQSQPIWWQHVAKFSKECLFYVSITVVWLLHERFASPKMVSNKPLLTCTHLQHNKLENIWVVSFCFVTFSSFWLSRRSLWAMKATTGFWWVHVACAFSTVRFDRCNPPPLISLCVVCMY